jgi:hypothetical protein
MRLIFGAEQSDLCRRQIYCLKKLTFVRRNNMSEYTSITLTPKRRLTLNALRDYHSLNSIDAFLERLIDAHVDALRKEIESKQKSDNYRQRCYGCEGIGLVRPGMYTADNVLEFECHNVWHQKLTDEMKSQLMNLPIDEREKAVKAQTLTVLYDRLAKYSEVIKYHDQ